MGGIDPDKKWDCNLQREKADVLIKQIALYWATAQEVHESDLDEFKELVLRIDQLSAQLKPIIKPYANYCFDELKVKSDLPLLNFTESIRLNWDNDEKLWYASSKIGWKARKGETVKAVLQAFKIK